MLSYGRSMIIGISSAFIVAGTTGVALSQSLTPSACGQILSHGLWANKSLTNSQNNEDAAKTWACSKSTSASGRADFTQKKGRAKFNKDEHCSTTARSRKEAERLNRFWKTASKEIVSAWSACIGSVDRNKYGLWIYADEVGPSGKFSLVISWNDPDKTNTTLPSVSIAADKAIKCKPAFPKTASRGRQTLNCKNTKTTEEQRITASSSATDINVTSKSATIRFEPSGPAVQKAVPFRYFARITAWDRLGSVGISNDGTLNPPAVKLTSNDRGNLIEVSEAAYQAVDGSGVLNATARRIPGRSGKQTAHVRILKGTSIGNATVIRNCENIGVGTGLRTRGECPLK